MEASIPDAHLVLQEDGGAVAWGGKAARTGDSAPLAFRFLPCSILARDVAHLFMREETANQDLRTPRPSLPSSRLSSAGSEPLTLAKQLAVLLLR